MSRKKARVKDHKWLAKHAMIAPSTISDDFGKVYLSNVDGSYLTRVDMESEVRFLVDCNLILVQSVHSKPEYGSSSACLGYNVETQHWWGWSHRAMYGFGIGSKVIMGDCAYTPTDKDDFLDDCNRFWTDENHINVMSNHCVEDGEMGVRTTWGLVGDDVAEKAVKFGITGVFSPYLQAWGKGEWEAKTLNDAKRMASDFARGVS